MSDLSGGNGEKSSDDSQMSEKTKSVDAYKNGVNKSEVGADSSNGRLAGDMSDPSGGSRKKVSDDSKLLEKAKSVDACKNVADKSEVGAGSSKERQGSNMSDLSGGNGEKSSDDSQMSEKTKSVDAYKNGVNKSEVGADSSNGRLAGFSLLSWFRGSYVCSSHHKHKAKADMEDCNRIRELELQNEERLQRERQKVLEMEKQIQMAKKRDEHLYEKNRVLQDMIDRDEHLGPETRAKILTHLNVKLPIEPPQKRERNSDSNKDCYLSKPAFRR